MINVGLIGSGGISGLHLNYLKTRKDVNIAALCDINPDQVQKRQREYGGKAFTDFKNMLDQTPLDAVWLCTPPSVRRDPLLACADRGIPVFCEKPVEISEERASNIASELAKRKARVQIGYLFRCLPVIDVLRKAMQGDSVYLVQSLYACNISLTMGMREWFYDKSKSGGGLVDQATHSLDLLRFLFGEVKEVHGMAANPVRKKTLNYTVDETIGLVFIFANEILATHMHTWVGDRWRNEIVISGEKRLYRLDSNSGCLVVEGPCEMSDIDNGRLISASAGNGFTFEQEPGSSCAYENERFLSQVLSGDWTRNPSDYEDGLKTLRLTLACDRAVTCGNIS